MVEAVSSAPSAASCRRGGGGVVGPTVRRCCGGCGLGRLVRRLRRQGRQALCAPRPAAIRGYCQYDPLSYARNFDQSGCGVADSDAAASLYYSYTFSSRFVLTGAPHPPPSSSAAAAPTSLAASRPTATSH